jgi:ABC-2 type transport system permease protein
MILIWLGALVLGSVVGFGIYASNVAYGSQGLASAWVGLALVWLIGPLAASALDETVEPRRLELLPIPSRSLIYGLLLAAAIGPGALASTLAVGVGLMGVGLIGFEWLVALAAAIVFIGWCLATSRLVTTVLSDVLRTRRGRDIATVLIAMLGAAVAFTSQAIAPGGRLPNLRPLLDGLALTPPGALARSVGAIRAGDPGRAVLLLMYGTAATAAAVWLWSRSLSRLSTRAPTSGRVRRSGEGTRFVPAILRPARLSPMVATAAKELKGIRRDPRMRSQFIGVGVAMVAVLLGAGRFVIRTGFAPLLAVVGGWVAVSGTGFNQFGMDDRSFWAYMVSGVDLRKVMAGKNLALIALGSPIAIVLGIAGAAVTGAFHLLPVALLAAGAVMAVWLAVGANASVLGPFPLPESNMFGSRNLPGSAFTASIGGIIAAGGLTLPVALMIGLPWLAAGEWAALGGAVLAFGYGVVIYRLGLQVAGEQLASRSQRMLEVLDKEK